MENITLSGISSWTGLIFLWIFVVWQLIDWKKRKKEGTFEYISKDSWWQRTYIWQVFFRRTQYRPIASTFPWLIFIVPAMLMIAFNSMAFFIGHPLKIVEMHKVSGIVTQAYRGKGKNSYDYITVMDDKGNEEKYRLCCFFNDEELEEFKLKIQNFQKKVDIWYEEGGFLWDKYKYLRELRINNNFIILNNKIHFQYDYQYFVNQYKNSLPNLLWWINYSLIGWIWLWVLNRKELPIHRLNKKKRYEKYNLKDE